MNEQRTFVTFNAVFPDDFEFLESGDIAVPGGRNICNVIMGILQNLGLTVSKPEQHQFYGWELTAKKDGCEYWFLLQYPESWLLIAQDKTGIFGRMKSQATSFGATLADLNQKLAEDERFSNIRWFAKGEYENGKSLGSKTPE